MNDDTPRPRWQRLLLNRFVLVPLILVLVAAGWDAYASTHDHGIVEGQVVDATEHPIQGAVVTLWVYNFATYVESAHMPTGRDGRFRFTDNPSHRIQVSATKPGIGSAERVPVPLYFRSEDTTLHQPLMLK